MRYWVGTMNRATTTDDNTTLNTADGWREVDEKEYDEAYKLAWKIACGTIWHC